MTGRIDLYRNVHKGLRLELLQFLVDLGRADLGSAEGTQRLDERFSSLVFLLERHAHHEDAFVAPVIRSAAPELARALTEEHREYDRRLLDLQRGLKRLGGAAGTRRLELGHQLYLGLEAFVSAYLAHLNREEVQASPVLWNAFSDEELAGIQDALVASIPPDEKSEFMKLMLSAMNIDERTEMLVGVRAGAPPEVFAALRELAEVTLDAGDFGALVQRLAAA